MGSNQIDSDSRGESRK